MGGYRGSEMAQTRVSSRGPALLRTSSSDSDPIHHRSITDRSPKLGDRRSPRSASSDPITQKKLGTRIAGLETQLETAQSELKLLKDQLASAEAAKKEAQKELEKRSKKSPVSEPAMVQDTREKKKRTKISPVSEPVMVQETRASPSENEVPNKEISEQQEIVDEIEKETDVFEVLVEPKVEVTQCCDQDKANTKHVNILPESLEKPKFHEVLAAKNEEISLLKAKIEENDKELQASGQENESLKLQLTEANVVISTAKAKEDEMSIKMALIEEEFKKSKMDETKMKEMLKEVEGAKEALETEMKKLRVQTEQWRKAGDAAAAILAGGVDMNEGRRVSERGSMDKHYGGVFDGYGGFVGSPGGMGDDSDDVLGSGKRKGSGIRMFGDLWKKKAQK